MSRPLFVIAFLTLSTILWGQDRCGTKTPTDGSFEEWMKKKVVTQLRRTRPAKQTTLRVPVVIHVLHQGEKTGTGSNLSKERIVGQIASLNDDFRRLNADRVNTPEAFLPVAADSEIEFVLARQDPAGNPSDGIVRVNASDSFDPRRADDLTTIRSLSFWPAESYLNIYVNNLSSDLIGLAIFPETDLDGIALEPDRLFLDAAFVDADYFGNNPDAPAFESRGRTLTHEIGHFLGLRHIWGDGGVSCSTDDFVSDTPPADFHNSGLSSPCSFPNPSDGTVCIPDQPEMFQNYMDYTDDICMNLFTEGQKTRMRVVLENSPRRNSLLTSAGLIEPARFENDLAVTNILSPLSSECSSQFTPSAEVTNWGTDTINSYQVALYVNGMLISISEKQKSLAPFEKDTVFFSNQIVNQTPGSVSFQITEVDAAPDGNELNNLLTTTIEQNTAASLPFIESFESGTLLVGQIGASNIWNIQNAPNLSAANNALTFNAFSYPNAFGSENIVTTPALDLSGFENVDLTFSYSYGFDRNAYHDGLQVLISYDCGRSYNANPVFEAAGADLATVFNFSSENAFNPTVDDWATVNILIPKPEGIGSYGDQVKLAFVGLNGAGNNLFIDDIIVNATNRKENDASITSLASPQVTCNDTSTVNVAVRNVGIESITSLSIDYSVGTEDFELSFEDLNIPADGFETLRFKVGNPEPVNELIVEIKEVNGVIDDSTSLNVIEATIQINAAQDEYPLNLDFETPDEWISSSPNSTDLWVRENDGTNGFLKANGFSQEVLGTESWFISPELNTGGLDSAGLFFRASYARRGAFNDQLSVAISNDCGETFSDPIFTASADSLAVAESFDRWVPTLESDWKEYRIDLKETIPSFSDLRIAFIFSNGNGNNLYLDDISIRGNEPPEYLEDFLVYPNPSSGPNIKLSFNFQQKKAVTVDVLNTSGQVVSQTSVNNALNQVISLSAPSQPGLYFVRVVGPNFMQTQKLFINP